MRIILLVIILIFAESSKALPATSILMPGGEDGTGFDDIAFSFTLRKSDCTWRTYGQDFSH